MTVELLHKLAHSIELLRSSGSCGIVTQSNRDRIVLQRLAVMRNVPTADIQPPSNHGGFLYALMQKIKEVEEGGRKSLKKVSQRFGGLK